MLGTVKWYNADKGYGFVKPDDGKKDVFVHSSALRKARIDSLAEGQRIEFDLAPGNKGECAVNLEVVQ